jgi:hypothetical protein
MATAFPVPPRRRRRRGPVERVAVIGSGNWGTAIARIVATNCARHPEDFEREVRQSGRTELRRHVAVVICCVALVFGCGWCLQAGSSYDDTLQYPMLK